MNLFYWLLIGIGVVTLVAFLIAFWYQNSEYHRPYWDDITFATFIAFIISVVVSVFVMLFAVMSFSSNSVGEDGVSESSRTAYDLKALNLEGEEYSTSSGYMFLLIGAGSSESGTYEEIQYIWEAPDGGMSLESVSLDESRVFEAGKDTQPYVEVINYRYDTSWYAPWTQWYDLHNEARYEFHVPVGTVVQNYSVDITAE